MRRHRVTTALLLLLLPYTLAATGCRRTPELVAKLTLSTKQIDLPHGRMVPLELRWEPSKPLPELLTWLFRNCKKWDTRRRS